MSIHGRILMIVVCLSLSASGLLAQGAPWLRVGVCTHFSQSKGHLPGNLSMIQQAGVTSIRDEASWSTLEREKGRLEMLPIYEDYVDAAVKTGLEPMIIFDYGNRLYDKGDKPLSEEAIEGFTQYSEFVVRHFRGKVKLYEVWNEWDIGIGRTTPGSAEAYANLLKSVYPRVKKIDPSITVYGGAMTSGGIQRGWLENMLKAGGLAYLDEVSIHTYIYSSTGRERTPEYWVEWMAKIQDLLRRYNGGKDVPLNVTEMGWPTQVDRRGMPPEISAAYLARMFLLARTMPFMKGIWWYDFQDDGWSHTYNENNFGIVRPDLTPKPGYFALKDIADLAGKADFVGRIDTGDPQIYVLRFRQAGAEVWALWSAHEDDGWQITLRSGTTNPPPLEFQEVGQGSGKRPWGSREWVGDRDASVKPDELSFVVRETPWLIRGNLGSVTVSGVTRREFPETLRGAQVLR